MKKGILFLMLSVLTLGVWADDVTAVVDNITSYSGTASFVYNKADGKVYARNDKGTYERYGVYEKVSFTQKHNEVDYIATDASHQTYINTGYIHKANTRIVADVEMTDEGNGWQAVFGARQSSYSSKAFVMFSTADHNGNRNGVFNRSGEETDFNANIPANTRIIIDAFGQTATVKKQSDGSIIATATTTGTADAGSNAMFIFNTNTAGAGGFQPDGSYNKMKLYSFRIYEGTTLVKDYIPVVTSEGKGGLKDKLTGNILTSAVSNVDFVHDAYNSSNDVPITTYNGKIVYNKDDKHTYQYNGSEFVDKGFKLIPISDTNYQNMKNWNCPDDHWESVFDEGNNIGWNEETLTNTFDPYVGKGGWEPLRYKFNAEVVADYNISFNYSTGGWRTWSNGGAGGGEVDSPVTMPFKIIDREAIEQNNGHFGTDAGWINGAQLTPEAQENTPVSVDFNSSTGIATFIMQFGVVDDNSHDPQYWFRFDNWQVKKYDFNASYSVMNLAYLINSLLEEVEAFDTDNTTDPLATSLNTAAAAARNSLDDAEDLEGQLNAMEALQTAFDKAKAINAAILRKTVALAEEEGVPHDEADNVLSNAETQKDVDDALAALRLARKRHNAEEVTEEFVGTAPAADLECYLYNVGEKKFLCGGNDWGTHASLGFAAHFVTLRQEQGGYKIQTHLPNGTEGTNDFLGENGYVDVTPGAVWQFVEIDGNYNIKLASDNTRLLGYESPTVNQISTNCKTTTGPTNQWKLVTKEERDALLVNATPDHPVDATYYIDNPGFDQRWTIEKWTMTDMAVNNRGQQKSDFVVSGWNESGDGNTAEDFKIEQVITGLMPGLYEVGVQACYRHGGDSEDDGESYAKLFANNQVTTILGVKDEINKIPQYTTLGTDEKAIEAFQTGLYKNKVRVAVGSDGRLTIGVKRDAADFRPYDWLAADNFRLTYLGPTSESVTVTSAGYATYCSENALDFSNTDIKAYVGTKNGDKLTFTPINQVPANTGLLLVYEGGKTEDVPVIASVSAVEGNCLVGVNEETTIDGNDYILNKINDGVGFYKAGSWTTLGAHKAYIPAAVGNGVKGFTIDFDDDATAIEMVNGQSSMVNGSIYNLAGQRLSKTQKGINIVNGKKILK